MKLLGALTSPYVRKVRIVMAEKKLDYQLVLEDVWANDTIVKANPLGKVPTLVMEGGEAVFDSRVIVEYLDTLSPVGRLIPAGTGMAYHRARRNKEQNEAQEQAALAAAEALFEPMPAGDAQSEAEAGATPGAEGGDA